ncbi:hypothetical protein [Haloarchaeobius sp. DFWS5]|uniref:hypothetical protein n=1 Tax=Haloarchaeobius sp. DFWS5 TaxID=3446114 RepID=UPI003EBB8BE2
MKWIPSPFDCLGVLGIVLAVVGILISLPLVLLWENVPWAWYLFVASGTLGAISVFYCMIWEWDRFPFSPPRKSA